MLKFVLCVALIVVLLLMVKTKVKRILAAATAAAVGAGGFCGMTFLRSNMQQIGDQASSVFSTIDLHDENEAYYQQFITPHDDDIRTSLLLGMDASGERADLILLVVSTRTSVTVFSIPRDTLVRISPFSSTVCKLSEVMVCSEERSRELAFVHVMELNYGMHVNNLTELQFQAIPEGIDQLFGTVEVELSGIEVAGLNQCAADTAARCHGEVKDYCILDETGNVMYAEELAWLCDPKNFCDHLDADGVPVDEDGTPTDARNEQLYKINSLIDKYHAPFGHLDETRRTYHLSGAQLLSCLRKRHSYASQAKARTEQAGLLLTSLVPRFIQKNTLDSDSQSLNAFCQYCAENGYLRTSYRNYEELEKDLISPIRPLSFGKVIDGVCYSDIPYWDLNYGAELQGRYVSVKEMTAVLVYAKEDAS